MVYWKTINLNNFDTVPQSELIPGKKYIASLPIVKIYGLLGFALFFPQKFSTIFDNYKKEMVTIYFNTELNFPQSVLETCIKLTRHNALGF